MQNGAVVEISVLGPVSVSREGVPIELGGRLRRLLAVLVAAGGDTVSSDRLVDAVWSGEPPEHADRTLRTYVTRLRKALPVERDELIVFRSPGYALVLEPGELDAETFDGELDDALRRLRTGDLDAASRLLQSALARWRGEAYAGFADEDWARPEAVRLTERREEAEEARIEVLLVTGRAEPAVASALQLVERSPLREQPRALLMRALYGSGRQAEALRAADEFRRHLAEETGLDPSDELTSLEERILRDDASLGVAGRGARGYELAERIGEGAFAVVHRATQPGLDRDVAVKIIRAELADRPDFVRRFEVEARTVARLEHPHIVPLYDFWREPGAAFLVMRLLRGGSVEESIRSRGSWSREQTVRLLDEVGPALEVAHRAGIVHGDVKPANLLLDERGTSYLADFGIAREMSTSDDAPLLSPAYAAPEVIRGDPVGHRADILSLAITTFEVLTGRLPFESVTSQAELIEQQLHAPLPPVRGTRPDLPVAVDEVIARATAKSPDDRQPTVGLFVEQLRAALESGSPASVVGAVGRATEVPAAEVANPYVGLHAFEELDADRFRGREALVTELVEAVERRALVTVVGPSGSGKSSAVRAGLIPAIRRGAVSGSEDWYVTTMMPGPDPIDALEVALLRVAVNPPASLRQQLAEPGGLGRAVRRVLPDDQATLLLVIDQFEELFTQVSGEDTRDRFLSELAAAAADPAGPLRVVTTLRADHYDAPLRHPAVAELVTRGTVTVRPLTPEELEQVIVGPARDVGVEVEPALVAELVAGVTDRPAALPLLQFALTEAFDRRTAGLMTLDTHREQGGLTGALASRAERILDAGGPADEAEARRIFGRLVTLGEGVEDTRRRALRNELGNGERTAWLLDGFGAARLLTFDRDEGSRAPTVEVAHEALLRDWPRLRDWLAEDRVDLRALDVVRNSTTAWVGADRDAGLLARGGRLELVADLLDRRPEWLTEGERLWVQASNDAAATEEAERAAAAEKDRRQNRRLRVLLTAAAVLLVVAVIGGTLAVVSRNDAVDARDQAELARTDAEIERLTALSASQIDTDPGLAILLALEANRRRPDNDTLTAIHRAIATEPRLAATYPSPVGSAALTFFSADGSTGLSVSFSDGRAVWFDTASGAVTAEAPTDVFYSWGQLSADGETAALTGADGRIRIARRTAGATGQEFAALGFGDVVAFGGGRIAYQVGDGVEVADYSTGEIVVRYVSPLPELPIPRLWLDETGETLLVVELSGLEGVDVVLVDVASGEEIARNTYISPISPEVAGSDGVVAVVFDDGTVRTLSTEDGSELATFVGHASAPIAVDVAAGVVATATPDEVRFWSVDGSPLDAAIDVTGLQEISLGAEGQLLVEVVGGDVRVYELEESPLLGRRWPARFSSVAPGVDVWDSPAPDFSAIEFRTFSDAELVLTIGADVHPDGIGGPPFYSTDGEWVVTYGAETSMAVTELNGSRQYYFEPPELWERLRGEPPPPEANYSPRPDGERVWLSTVGAERTAIAGWFDLESGELLDGPAEIPSSGRTFVLRDGRVAIGTEGAVQISGVDLDEPWTEVAGTETAVVYDQLESTGELVAVGLDGTVVLIDPDTATFRSFEPVDGFLSGAAASPDEDLLAVFTLENGIQLYDIESGERLGIAVGLPSFAAQPGLGARWEPDGSGVWTAPEGGPFLLAADPEVWPDIACQIVNRELTAEEWNTFVGDGDPVSACKD